MQSVLKNSVLLFYTLTFFINSSTCASGVDIETLFDNYDLFENQFGSFDTTSPTASQHTAALNLDDDEFLNRILTTEFGETRTTDVLKIALSLIDTTHEKPTTPPSTSTDTYFHELPSPVSQDDTPPKISRKRKSGTQAQVNKRANKETIVCPSLDIPFCLEKRQFQCPECNRWYNVGWILDHFQKKHHISMHELTQKHPTLHSLHHAYTSIRLLPAGSYKKFTSINHKGHNLTHYRCVSCDVEHTNCNHITSHINTKHRKHDDVIYIAMGHPKFLPLDTSI